MTRGRGFRRALHSVHHTHIGDYRSTDHRVLEREEEFDASKVRETETVYSLDEYGNPVSGVRQDFKPDDRNLQGSIAFDYGCFR